MVIVRQRGTVGTLQVKRCISAVSLQDLDIADGMALAVDGEAQAGALREVTIEHRPVGRTAGEHLLHLLTTHHDPAQGIVVG